MYLRIRSDIDITLEALKTLALMQGGHFSRSGQELSILVSGDTAKLHKVFSCCIPNAFLVEPTVFHELRKHGYIIYHARSLQTPDSCEWRMTDRAKALLSDAGLRDVTNRPHIETISWLIGKPMYGA